ncbi:hypothetical protein BG22_06970 [Bifidobacterium sp. UTBIF-78]|nr:hypothetical protein BG22_06970 [Bifidobacterium sp. UTBIF-78]
MTDNTETAVSPDPRAIAQAVLLEVADEPEQVGQFVEAIELEDHVTDFRFQSDVRGYEGWQWSVTLFHDIELDSWTVNESSLVPTDSALMPPKWVPWKDRLEPTDLSPTDSIGTDPDDERIEPGEAEPSSLEDVNDAVQTFRLTRRHVLSPLGRAQAAKRWYEGPRGPKALSTKTAEGNLCSTCGFFVPLTGELDRMFGVCANKWSPDDGRVVSLDHGCGEHSEIEPPEPSHLWIQSKPAFDDLHVDIVAAPKKPRTDSDQEQSDDREETREEALAGVVADAVDLDDSTSTVVEDSEEDAADVTGVGTAVDSNGSSRTDDADDTDDFITGDEDESDDDESDEATEQDILENTEPDDGDDLDEDESDEDADGVVSVDDTVAPGLEAVVDLIEQLRQARADAEAKRAIEEDADDDSYDSDDSDESGDGLDESDDSDEDLDDSGSSDDFDDGDESDGESGESDESNDGSDESDGDAANNGDASDEDETEGISDESYDELNGKSDGTSDDESDESADGSGDLDELGDGLDESDDSDEDLVYSDGSGDSGDGDESDGEPVVDADIDDDADDADTDSDAIDAVDEGNDGDVSESGDDVEDSDPDGATSTNR